MYHNIKIKTLFIIIIIIIIIIINMLIPTFIVSSDL